MWQKYQLHHKPSVSEGGGYFACTLSGHVLDCLSPLTQPIALSADVVVFKFILHYLTVKTDRRPFKATSKMETVHTNVNLSLIHI